MASTKAPTAVPVKAPKPRATVLTPHERRQLAGKSLVDERTIRRWEAGAPILLTTRKVLDEAARKLGLPVPERKR